MLLLHQGEELVIALPAVMLGAAFFLLKWAAGNDSEDHPDEPPVADELLAAPSVGVDTPELVLTGASGLASQVPVEPPDEGQPADHPQRHDR